MLRSIAAFFACLLLTIACGSNPPSMPSAVDVQANENQKAGISEDVQQDGFYLEAAIASHMRLVLRDGILTAPAETIYIALDGIHVSSGFNKEQSSLLCDERVAVPGSGLSMADKADLQFFVQNYLNQTYPGLTVTFARPVEKDYSTVVVTTDHTALGCPMADIKYRAVVDSYALSFNDTAFVFAEATESLDDLIVQVETAVEKILGWESGRRSPGIVAVQQQNLPGLDELHSMSQLVTELKDEDIVDISVLRAEIDRLLPRGLESVHGFDRILTVTLGVSEKHSVTEEEVEKPRFFAWIDQLLGDQENRQNGADLVSAIAILAGAPQIAAAIQILGPILIAAGETMEGQRPSAGPTVNSRGINLPRFDEMLGLERVKDPAQLVAHLRGHAQFTAEQYSSSTTSAINAMLAVAYSQLLPSVTMQSAP